MKRKIIAFVMTLIMVIPSVFLFSGCDLFDFGTYDSNSTNSSSAANNYPNYKITFTQTFPCTITKYYHETGDIYGVYDGQKDLRIDSAKCSYSIYPTNTYVDFTITLICAITRVSGNSLSSSKLFGIKAELYDSKGVLKKSVGNSVNANLNTKVELIYTIMVNYPDGIPLSENYKIKFISS